VVATPQANRDRPPAVMDTMAYVGAPSPPPAQSTPRTQRSGRTSAARRSRMRRTRSGMSRTRARTSLSRRRSRNRCTSMPDYTYRAHNANLDCDRSRSHHSFCRCRLHARDRQWTKYPRKLGNQDDAGSRPQTLIFVRCIAFWPPLGPGPL